MILFCRFIRIDLDTKSYVEGGEKLPKRISSLQRAREQEVTLEILPINAFQSFRCFTHDYPALGARYCVHVEYEIHLIRKGTGHFKIGGQIGKFKAGQVSIIGSQVPHDWVSDLRKNQIIKERDVVIQFSREWIEKVKHVIPEVSDFEKILDQAQRAIIFAESAAEILGPLINTLTKTTGIEQVTQFFEILNKMSQSLEAERQYILEDSYSIESTPQARLVAEKGVSYIFTNIDKKILLSDAAKLSFMSESTFSRIFKLASGLNFSEMIRKLRIENGCKLLSTTDLSVSTIAQKSGFQNQSNFNRQFLKETQITPRQFRSLKSRERELLIKKIFGHKNELMQQTREKI